MKQRERDLTCFLDIVQSSERAIQHVQGLSFEAFERDEKASDAVRYCLTVIGEASRRVSAEMRAELNEVPWRKIIGLRNILVHEYDDVVLSRIWEIVKTDLPELAKTLRPYIPPEPPS